MFNLDLLDNDTHYVVLFVIIHDGSLVRFAAGSLRYFGYEKLS